MRKLKIFISGQKYFAAEVLRICLRDGHDVVGVCCPLDDKYIAELAHKNNIPVLPSGMLNKDTMPACDLGIAAHSFDYIGRLTRYKPSIGWIGYHPSLLPRHRGKSSIEWAVRMRDCITGGTIFWLNSGIDRGDVAYQNWIFIDPAMFSVEPKKAARLIWSGELLPMGLALMERALKDIASGIIIRFPQNKKFSTFEPSTDVPDIYKPDLLMLE